MTKLADWTLIALSAAAAYWLCGGVLEKALLERYSLATITGLFIWRGVANLSNMYELPRLLDGKSTIVAIVFAWTTTALVLMVLCVLLRMVDEFSHLWFALWYVIGVSSVVIGRLVIGAVFASAKKRGLLQWKAILLGANDLSRSFVDAIERDSLPKFKVIAVFDDHRRSATVAMPNLHIQGAVEDALGYARSHRIDAVIIALPAQAGQRVAELVGEMSQLSVDIYVVPEALACMSSAHRNAGFPLLISISEKPLKDWKALVKSIEDRILGSLMLLFAAPLMLVIALAIKCDSAGPVLFRQKRVGYNTKLFDCYKFRTMYAHMSDPLADQLARRSDPRVTRVGAFLRKTSLDELPQLFNVVKGEMSLVGPRPHAINAKAAGKMYPDAVPGYLARHRVKPGITGWAQVNGWRGETDSIEKLEGRVEHDLFYIQNWSFGLDVWILFLTLFKGFIGKNTY